MLGSAAWRAPSCEAFTCVRDIRLCKVYSPNRQIANASREEMSKRLNIEVRAVDNPRRSHARRRYRLSSATDSMRPVYDADWIAGQHVTNLGRREMPSGNGDVRRGGPPGNAGSADEADGALPSRARHSPAAFIGGTGRNQAHSASTIRSPDSAAIHPNSRTVARAATSPNSPISSPANARAARPATRSRSSQRRQSGPAVLGGRRLGLRQGKKGRATKFRRNGSCRTSGIVLLIGMPSAVMPALSRQSPSSTRGRCRS